MYNPQKVIDLIESCGVRRKELLTFMGKNWNGSVDAVIKGDIRVSKLEKIADFFGVPVDTFFDRDACNSGVQVGGLRNHVHNFSVGTSSKEKRVLEELLAEKEKRIQVLEDMVELLKKQLDNK